MNPGAWASPENNRSGSSQASRPTRVPPNDTIQPGVGCESVASFSENRVRSTYPNGGSTAWVWFGEDSLTLGLAMGDHAISEFGAGRPQDRRRKQRRIDSPRASNRKGRHGNPRRHLHC